MTVAGTLLVLVAIVLLKGHFIVQHELYDLFVHRISLDVLMEDP